jgi:Cupin superfamily (DUF985)
MPMVTDAMAHIPLTLPRRSGMRGSSHRRNGAVETHTVLQEVSRHGTIAQPSGLSQAQRDRGRRSLMNSRIQTLIDSLRLQPHPEGGYYREVFRSEQIVMPAGKHGERRALTSIYFLLAAGQSPRRRSARAFLLRQRKQSCRKCQARALWPGNGANPCCTGRDLASRAAARGICARRLLCWSGLRV